MLPQRVHSCPTSRVETGPSAATVSVFWGTANGGVNRAAWANTNVWAAGAWTNNTCPSLALTGLAPSTTYYYTFGATNASGSVIATPSTSFTTCEAANGPVITLK